MFVDSHTGTESRNDHEEDEPHGEAEEFCWLLRNRRHLPRRGGQGRADTSWPDVFPAAAVAALRPQAVEQAVVEGGEGGPLTAQLLGCRLPGGFLAQACIKEVVPLASLFQGRQRKQLEDLGCQSIGVTVRQLRRNYLQPALETLQPHRQIRRKSAPLLKSAESPGPFLDSKAKELRLEGSNVAERALFQSGQQGGVGRPLPQRHPRSQRDGRQEIFVGETP
jgi:hypothetical protein